MASEFLRLLGQARLPGQRPAVLVPAAVADRSAAAAFAGQVQDLLRKSPSCVQAIEWRVDALSDFRVANLQAVFVQLAVAGLPVFATVRTRHEGGGAFAGDGAAYAALVAEVSEFTDVVGCDVELMHPGAQAAMAAVRKFGKVLISSYHNWGCTPALQELLALSTRMQETAADVLKIAVAAKDASDLEVLLALRKSVVWEQPLILIAMGDGAIANTRTLANPLGSAATFAVVGEATAPGQKRVADLL